MSRQSCGVFRNDFARSVVAEELNRRGERSGEGEWADARGDVEEGAVREEKSRRGGKERWRGRRSELRKSCVRRGMRSGWGRRARAKERTL